MLIIGEITHLCPIWEAHVYNEFESVGNVVRLANNDFKTNRKPYAIHIWLSESHNNFKFDKHQVSQF